MQVYLWDQRGGSAPRTKLGMGSGFSMNSLQLSEDANLLLVGTQTGDVRTAALLVSYVHQQHLPVACADGQLPGYMACPVSFALCFIHKPSGRGWSVLTV